MPTERWSVERYRKFVETGVDPGESARHDHSPLPAPNVELHPSDGAKTTDAAQEVPARVRIHVHSRRRRLADPGGISFKAVVDGLTEGELLPDDSATYVESITESQEQSPFEETVIEIYEADWPQIEEALR